MLMAWSFDERTRRGEPSKPEVVFEKNKKERERGDDPLCSGGEGGEREGGRVTMGGEGYVGP